MLQSQAESPASTLPNPAPRPPWRYGVAVVLVAVVASGLVSAVVARWTVSKTPAATTSPTVPLPPAELAEALGAPPPPPQPSTNGGTAAGQTPILPGPNFDLRLFTGQSISVPAAPVQTKVGARGFWIGTSASDRIFIRFDEPGVEPPNPAVGHKFTVSGKFMELPADFETKFGVGGADRDHLRSQGLYLHVTATRPA